VEREAIAVALPTTAASV